MAEKEEFIEVLKTTPLIALASAGEAGPNVRIMDFLFDEEAKTIYFPTSSRSHKVAEFEANNTVALTTIPMGPGAVVRIQGAKVSKSAKSVADVREALTAKRGGVAHLLDAFGETGVVYEIPVTGGVIIDKGKPSKVEL